MVYFLWFISYLIDILLCHNFLWILEKAREFQKTNKQPKKNIYFCFIDYTKTFDCVDHNKLENLRWEYQSTLSVFGETCMQVKEQQLEPDMQKQTGFKLGKEYIKAV